MSEYQYYEFLALDSQLDKKQQKELREISSRARITSTSFVNYYHYGDLHAEPNDLMTKYFDLFVYTASWGSASFSIKIPKSFIKKTVLACFSVDAIFSYFSSGSDWIINWSVPENENYDRFTFETGEGWMTRLLGIREELMGGDYRSLYIGWLCAATFDEVAENSKEPMQIVGLTELTASQTALAEFIEVDFDLITAAAAGSLDINQSIDLELDDWLTQLSKQESFNLLKSVFNEPAHLTQVKLKQAYRQWREDNIEPTSIVLRTLNEINRNKNSVKEKRLQQDKIEQDKKRKRKENARKKHLNELYAKANYSWKTAVFHMEKSTGKGYDDAVALLSDLKEAYQQNEAAEKYQKKLNQIILANQKRPALLKRIKVLKLVL